MWKHDMWKHEPVEARHAEARHVEHCTAYDMRKHDMDLPIVLHKRKRETRKFREAAMQQDQ